MGRVAAFILNPTWRRGLSKINRNVLQNFLRRTSHYESITIIMCQSDRIFGKGEPIIEPYDKMGKHPLTTIYSMIQEIQQWIEAFPNDDDEKSLPPISFVLSSQNPIINQDLQPNILPAVDDIFLFTRHESPNINFFYEEDCVNLCFQNNPVDSIYVL